MTLRRFSDLHTMRVGEALGEKGVSDIQYVSTSTPKPFLVTRTANTAKPNLLVDGAGLGSIK
jgi:hypothetical protein